MHHIEDTAVYKMFMDGVVVCGFGEMRIYALLYPLSALRAPLIEEEESWFCVGRTNEKTLHMTSLSREQTSEPEIIMQQEQGHGVHSSSTTAAAFKVSFLHYRT